jgi:hypothetical protein
MCWDSLRRLSDWENGPLMALGEAEETEVSRPSAPVAAVAGDLATTMCLGSLRSLAGSKNGPLTVLGEAEEAEETHPSGPGATLLAVLSSAACSPTLILVPGYPVRLGPVWDRACTRAPLPPTALSATTDPVILDSAAHGPTLLMAPGHPVMLGPVWGRACTRVPLPPTALYATTDPVILGSAARGPILLMVPSYPVMLGPVWGRACTRVRVPPPSAALSATTYLAILGLTVLGEVEEVEGNCPSGSVAASAGDLLTTMCRGLLRGVAALAGDLLTTMCWGSPTSLADLENGRPSRPCATRTLLMILGSIVHRSPISNLLTRMTRGFLVSVGCTCQAAVLLPPPIIGPTLTESASGVWAGGPLSS